MPESVNRLHRCAVVHSCLISRPVGRKVREFEEESRARGCNQDSAMQVLLSTRKYLSLYWWCLGGCEAFELIQHFTRKFAAETYIVGQEGFLRKIQHEQANSLRALHIRRQLWRFLCAQD